MGFFLGFLRRKSPVFQIGPNGSYGDIDAVLLFYEFFYRFPSPSSKIQFQWFWKFINNHFPNRFLSGAIEQFHWLRSSLFFLILSSQHC
jgi:hypothetical protein